MWKGKRLVRPVRGRLPQKMNTFSCCQHLFFLSFTLPTIATNYFSQQHTKSSKETHPVCWQLRSPVIFCFVFFQLFPISPSYSNWKLSWFQFRQNSNIYFPWDAFIFPTANASFFIIIFEFAGIDEHVDPPLSSGLINCCWKCALVERWSFCIAFLSKPLLISGLGFLANFCLIQIASFLYRTTKRPTDWSWKKGKKDFLEEKLNSWQKIARRKRLVVDAVQQQ